MWRGLAGTPCNMPLTLMSSSMSAQCAPCPLPISRNLLRCSGVASDSLHDQASGTLISRPSESTATIASSVTFSVTIRGSSTVLMPNLYDLREAIHYQFPNLIEFLRTEAIIPRERYRFKPKLARAAIALNMHMHGLVAIEAIKEQPVRSRDIRNRWHRFIAAVCSRRRGSCRSSP